MKDNINLYLEIDKSDDGEYHVNVYNDDRKLVLYHCSEHLEVILKLLYQYNNEYASIKIPTFMLNDIGKLLWDLSVNSRKLQNIFIDLLESK